MPLASLLRDKLKAANRRLLIALACYAVLLGVALYVLLPVRSDYELRLLVLVLAVAALFIVKTLIHSDDDTMK